MGDHFSRRVWNEEFSQVYAFFWVEPSVIRLCRKDDGHAIVNGGHQVVGFGRDNGAGLDAFSGGRVPHVPKAGKGKGHAGVERDVHGRFGSAIGVALPFVKSGCGNEASLFFVRHPKRGFFRKGFSPRIDEAIADFAVFCPRRNQPPFEGVCTRLMGVGYRGNILPRRDVVSLGHRGGKVKLRKCALILIALGSINISTTHKDSLSSAFICGCFSLLGVR